MSRIGGVRPAPAKPAGFALLMALVVVLLLSAFITEYFFNTGLELRSMQTFKDAAQARNLARLAFKAVQIGLLNKESDIFPTYRQLEQLLTVSTVPWQEGLLVKLRVIPQDSLFNLNQLDLRDETDRDAVRWNLFLNTLADVEVAGEDSSQESEPLEESKIADMYAALVDWLDGGANATYQGDSGGTGAEEEAYLSSDPEVRIRNGQLDRLSEIRLIRGVAESRIPWEVWEKEFAVLEKSKSGEHYPEKLNINLATREEVVEFLQRRRMATTAYESNVDATVQEDINAYADNAEDIAAALLPENLEGGGTVYDQQLLEQVLKTIPAIKANQSGKLFIYNSQFYRIQIVTAMNEVEARLEAVINVPRIVGGVGTGAKVLSITVE